MENYSFKTKISVIPEDLIKALTLGIPLWWTDMFVGSADNTGDVFTVRFGESVYKTMVVEELNDKKVVWFVKDSLIAIPELKNQSEWIGTTIIWEITEEGNNIELKLTHRGLNQNVECYDICVSGWQQFISSLKLFLETGKGNPFTK